VKVVHRNPKNVYLPDPEHRHRIDIGEPRVCHVDRDENRR
jgi:hypothetical protein